MSDHDQDRAAKDLARIMAAFDAVPTDLRETILDVMKRHDSDNFSVGDDDFQLACLLDDLRRAGLEIVRRP